MTQTSSSFIQSDQRNLHIQGRWVLANYRALLHAVRQEQQNPSDYQYIDFSQLDALDTAGAEQLCHLIPPDQLLNQLAQAQGLSDERKALLQTVAEALSKEAPPTKRVHYSAIGNFFAGLGANTHKFYSQVIELMAFTGLVLEVLFKNLLRPSQWRINAIVTQIEETGLNAVPIVCLLTFLVGAVIAFLGATILTEFGATAYTVDLVGFSFMREFAVLLTAILMAGRTASAFTAQIGSMKANEEIDALQAQGLSPILLLVIPRIIAMLITLPLLTFVGTISGIVGGALVCIYTLDISPNLFITLLDTNVSVTNLYLGLSKAPIFAFLIAIIGCLQGFKVSGSAQSVGEHTTASVVHSIFIVILLDAVAALYFMQMGW